MARWHIVGALGLCTLLTAAEGGPGDERPSNRNEQGPRLPRPLVVTSARGDPAQRELLIIGREFGSRPQVTLGERRLEVVSATPEMIVARLPHDLPGGSYLLIVSRIAWRPGRLDLSEIERHQRWEEFGFFNVAIGVTGPPGEPGPKGDKGEPGPLGPRGEAGAPLASFDALAGLFCTHSGQAGAIAIAYAPDGQATFRCELSCPDVDGDGFFARAGCGSLLDCDDRDPAIHPQAAEVCGNLRDDNCDGRIDEDCPNDCPAPPASSAEALTVWTEWNSVRRAMGLACGRLVLEISAAAQNHSAYYVRNRLNPNCAPGWGSEIPGCPLFTGTSFASRMQAAGYVQGVPRAELLASGPNPTAILGLWTNAVAHRTLLLDPWSTDMGYGSSEDFATMDLGQSGTTPPNSFLASYPYDGQTGVTSSYDGTLEQGLPVPPQGWPSGYPIAIFVQGAVVTHELRIDGNPNPILHFWLQPGANAGLVLKAFIMYSVAPLAPNTRYRVHVEGTNSAGPFVRDWVFTTGLQ